MTTTTMTIAERNKKMCSKDAQYKCYENQLRFSQVRLYDWFVQMWC